MSSVGIPKFTFGSNRYTRVGIYIYIDRDYNELTFWYLKVEKLGNVHHQFQKLLTELKKPTDAYELNIANKFYGENKYPFLQVSFTWPSTPYLNPGPSVLQWPNGRQSGRWTWLIHMGSIYTGCKIPLPQLYQMKFPRTWQSASIECGFRDYFITQGKAQ